MIRLLANAYPEMRVKRSSDVIRFSFRFFVSCQRLLNSLPRIIAG